MLSNEQESLLNHFKKAVRDAGVSNSYIINGPEGVGKKYLADNLSLVFSCEKNEGCGQCLQCKSTLKGANPDIIKLCPEENKNYDVDTIREVIKKVYEKSVGRYKVIIFDKAHLLTHACQNALLKAVEEPPSYAVFIFLSSDLTQILQTLRSRSSVFNMHPWKLEEIKKVLPLSDDKKFLYEISDFNIGKLKTLLSDDDFIRVREETVSTFVRFIKKDEKAFFDAVKTFEKEKDRIAERLETLSSLIRDVLLFKDNINELITNKDKLKEIEVLSHLLSKEVCGKIQSVILSYFGRCKKGENPTMTSESLFMRLEEEIND